MDIKYRYKDYSDNDCEIIHVFNYNGTRYCVVMNFGQHKLEVISDWAIASMIEAKSNLPDEQE